MIYPTYFSDNIQYRILFSSILLHWFIPYVHALGSILFPSEIRLWKFNLTDLMSSTESISSH